MKTLLLSIALIAFTFVSCDKSQAPTQNANTGFSKATVTKDLTFGPFCGATVNCPNTTECICLTITEHIVVNDNGYHIELTYSGYGADCITGAPTGTTYSGHENRNGSLNNGSLAVT